MRPRLSLLLLLLAVLLSPTTLKANHKLEALAHQAVSNDQKAARAAIAELRSLGPAGMDAMLAVHAGVIHKQIMYPPTTNSPEWERLSAALDAISQQKNSHLSGMYWYTDMGVAKAAAKRSGKPILSLRLLGKLSDEFSCANSRFFRTILYSNVTISDKLRRDFVLHWKSVRPVPRVTIDFGDGRKLERTLTGNSIHYILDVEGRIIEALPGLYGPNAFLRSLLASEKVFAKLREAKDPNPGPGLNNYRRERINALYDQWLADLQKIGGKMPPGSVQGRPPDGNPIAIVAAATVVTKAATEVRLLRSLTSGAESLGQITDEATWRKIAQLHLSDAQLDWRSVALIQRETYRVLGQNDLKPLLEKLQLNVAMDSVRNEYLMRARIYGWLVEDRGRSDLESFNSKVYAELFLTPAYDPWLGLYTPDTYMALDDSGVVR